MDNIKELTVDELRKFLNENEFKYQTAQTVLCFAIIKRLYERLCLGYEFNCCIYVCRYRNIVVDGNHTYISYLLAKKIFREFEGTSSHSVICSHYKTIKIDEVNDWDDNSVRGMWYKSEKYLNSIKKVEF